MYKIKRFSKLILEDKEFSRSLGKGRKTMVGYESIITAHLALYLYTNDVIGDCSDHWTREFYSFISDAMREFPEKNKTVVRKFSYSEMFPHFLGGETDGYDTAFNNLVDKLEDELTTTGRKALNLVKSNFDVVLNALKMLCDEWDKIKKKLNRLITSNDKEDIHQSLINVRNKYKQT